MLNILGGVNMGDNLVICLYCLVMAMCVCRAGGGGAPEKFLGVEMIVCMHPH